MEAIIGAVFEYKYNFLDVLNCLKYLNFAFSNKNYDKLKNYYN